ncbi:MAG: hypothetical protein B7Y56_03330 [Gallionellales bacterium 35-53-114]|jgi:hypothetical protein|nr:MAG: hypothetical protein B7Y56_03330 [Gallionellales bacterium 35-53-114]OYZ65137.1 MAG: hypothetical protein B7Y04_00490 [Gallionellales bacterium 24-53-125]OZB08045.1 MAG: hypothetical protein B7X61_10940 [Gallionellales bacterium 39-52-133]HQS59948.1 hypothetical protein [Gallionellaceae bacterium]HQS76670.1 hypothetical protein [Gallionellaceae bacterium]
MSAEKQDVPTFEFVLKEMNEGLRKPDPNKDITVSLTIRETAVPKLQAWMQADMILLATEQRDLMPPHDDEWVLIKGISPMAEVINPWHPEKAEREFLKRWEELGGVMG